MAETPELTYDDALKLVEALSVDKNDWRVWSKRSDGERLAIGLVVLQKHLKGKTLRDIEKELGIPYATCQRYKERALASIQLPTVDAARKEELDRLEAIIRAIWPAVESGDDKAIANYMKVSERRAKLLGLDRPIEVTQTVYEETAQERELRQLMEQAERDQKMEEARLLEESTQGPESVV